MISRIVRPLASKIQFTGALPTQTILFASPLSRCFSKVADIDKAERKLKKIISQEIEFENDNYTEDQSARQYLTENKWVMEDKEETNLIVLKRVSGNSVVQIFFTSKSPSYNNEADQEEDEENKENLPKEAEEEDQGNFQDQEFTDFNVYVTRGRQTLAFECVSVNGEIEINNCNVVDDINIHRTQSPFNMTAVESYKGPEFGTLDEGVQQSLFDLLRAHGVNEELAQLIEHIALDKEQRLYVRWLEQVQGFIDQK